MRRPKAPRIRERIRKTDFGTILLHWILVITLMLSIGTGLRIAMDSPEHSWLVAFDAFLPLYTVWTLHIPAALVLFAVSVAYAAYIWRGGLMRRIRFDQMRLSGLLNRSRQVRWGSINIILYWVLFATMIMEIVTGTLLWLGYGRGLWVDLHMWGTWIILGYAVAHVLAHFALGGSINWPGYCGRPAFRRRRSRSIRWKWWRISCIRKTRRAGRPRAPAVAGRFVSARWCWRWWRPSRELPSP